MTRFIVVVALGMMLLNACQSEDGKGALTESMLHDNESAWTGGNQTRLVNVKPDYKVGQVIDWLNGIPIYYNRDTYNSHGRHVADDGYNYGLKWQCVEFVKRFYYDYLNHSMPDTYGHAKHFFQPEVVDGAINLQRNLRQFKNGGVYRPRVNDIIVFEGKNYGHVAIISRVLRDEIEITQQNVGKASRHQIKLYHSKGRYYIMNKAVLGWLGKR